MKTYTMNLLPLALVFAHAWQAAAAHQPEPDPSIVKLADSFRQAVLAGDAVAIAATYREDAVEMPPGRPRLTGRAAIERCYRELFQSGAKVTAFTFSHLETFAAGDVGYSVGTYRQQLSGMPSGSVEDSGSFVAIVKRTHREWKTAYVIYTSDRAAQPQQSLALPVPFPQQDLAQLAGRFSEAAYARITRTGLVAFSGVLLAFAVLASGVNRNNRVED